MRARNRILPTLAIIGAVLAVISCIAEPYLFFQVPYGGLWGLILPFLGLVLGIVTIACNRSQNSTTHYFGMMATVFGAVIFGLFGIYYGIALLEIVTNSYFYL